MIRKIVPYTKSHVSWIVTLKNSFFFAGYKAESEILPRAFLTCDLHPILHEIQIVLKSSTGIPLVNLLNNFFEFVLVLDRFFKLPSHTKVPRGFQVSDDKLIILVEPFELCQKIPGYWTYMVNSLLEFAILPESIILSLYLLLGRLWVFILNFAFSIVIYYVFLVK